MNKIKKFEEKVWDRITELFKENFRSTYLLNDEYEEKFRSVAKYILDVRHGQRASRVRACYVGYTVSNTESPDIKQLASLASALELANTSITYIEDKIIDSDEVNSQGNPWLHTKYGLPLTVVINSFMHQLARHAFNHSLRSFSESTEPDRKQRTRDRFESIFRDAAYGQFLDIVEGDRNSPTNLTISNDPFENNFEYVLSDYINELRTGQFVRKSAEIGALYAGKKVSDDDFSSISEAFRLIGISVQDLNDLEDFYPVDKFPGTVHNDLKLIKKTYPILRLLEEYEMDNVDSLADDIRDPSIPDDKIVDEARECIIKSGILKESLNKIEDRIRYSHDILESAFPHTSNLLGFYFDSFYDFISVLRDNY